MKESFIMFYEYEEYFKELSKDDRAELIMAIFAYENRKEILDRHQKQPRQKW